MLNDKMNKKKMPTKKVEMMEERDMMMEREEMGGMMTAGARSGVGRLQKAKIKEK